MGGKKDKKKKANKDPLKKAALAAKKEAKADKAALKRIQKEQDRLNAISLNDDDDVNDGKRSGSSKKGNKQSGGGNDIDSILNEYRSQTKELSTSEVEVIDSFPNPPRGNFTWTLCPTNGMFYMVSTKEVVLFICIVISWDLCSPTYFALCELQLLFISKVWWRIL